MAGRRAQRPQPVAQVGTTDVDDPTTSRALDELRSAIQALQTRPVAAPIVQDLVVGSNVVEHSLGRAPRFVSVMPTVADASFAWAVPRTYPHPTRQVVIDVIGVAQPGASILVI